MNYFPLWLETVKRAEVQFIFIRHLAYKTLGSTVIAARENVVKCSSIKSEETRGRKLGNALVAVRHGVGHSLQGWKQNRLELLGAVTLKEMMC